MRNKNGRAAVACFAAALTVPMSIPAHAQASLAEAEAIRKLDIMLMVSALVCRSSKYNFQSEYERFSARHLPALNAAYRLLHADLARVHGATKAKKLLDSMSVRMANSYGSGHPWLGCEELKETTAELANRTTGHRLHASAVYLLADAPAGAGTILAAG